MKQKILSILLFFYSLMFLSLVYQCSDPEQEQDPVIEVPGEANGLGGNVIQSITASGDIWYIATTKGLTIGFANATSFVHLDIESGLPEANVKHAIIHQERLWIATWGGGVARTNSEQLRVSDVFNKKNGLPSNRINLLYQSGKRLYIGTDEGLVYTDNEGGSFSDNLLAQSIYSLAIFDEQLFIGTSNGLYVADKNGDDMERYSTEESILSNLIFSLKKINDKLYLGTSAGIQSSATAPDNFKNITIDQGLLANPTFSIATSDADEIFTAHSSPFASGVSVSEDGGGKWKAHAINKKLSLFSASVVYFAEETGVLALGTQNGFYKYLPNGCIKHYLEKSDVNEIDCN